MGNKIEVDPAALLNAANGLDQYAKPDLEQVAKRCPPPTSSIRPAGACCLSVFEAQFNAVGDYHAKNLQAAGEATAAIAAGLRTTVDNYNRTEAANVSMMLGTPVGGRAELGRRLARLRRGPHLLYRAGLVDGAASARASPSRRRSGSSRSPSRPPTWSRTTCRPRSPRRRWYSTATRCSRWPARSTTSPRTSRAPSTSSPVTPTGRPPAGRTPASSAYRNVVAELIHELQPGEGQPGRDVDADQGRRGAADRVLVAFLVFTAAFFIDVTRDGPAEPSDRRPPAVIAALQAMGGLAAAEWMTAVVSVISLGAASALGVLIASLAGLVVIQTAGPAGRHARRISARSRLSGTHERQPVRGRAGRRDAPGAGSGRVLPATPGGARRDRRRGSRRRRTGHRAYAGGRRARRARDRPPGDAVGQRGAARRDPRGRRAAAANYAEAVRRGLGGATLDPDALVRDFGGPHGMLGSAMADFKRRTGDIEATLAKVRKDFSL